MHRHADHNPNNHTAAADPAVVATSLNSSSSSSHTTTQQPPPVQPDDMLLPLYDSALDVVWIPFELMDDVNPLELALESEHLPERPTLGHWVHRILNHDPAVHPLMANSADTSLEQMQGIVQSSTINATPAISPTITPPPSLSVTIKSESLTENNTSNEQSSSQIPASQVYECPHARAFDCRAILHGHQDLQQHLRAHAKLESLFDERKCLRWAKIWEELL